MLIRLDAQPQDRVDGRGTYLDHKTVAVFENQAFTESGTGITNHVRFGYSEPSGCSDLELHGDFLIWHQLDGLCGGEHLLLRFGILRGGLLGWRSLLLPLLFFELLQDATQGFDLLIGL